jgi:hypothetical protein
MPRQRVCLESGLKLDLNRLRRQGGVRPGAKVGPNVIRWTNTYTGEETTSGLITANGRDHPKTPQWLRTKSPRTRMPGCFVLTRQSILMAGVPPRTGNIDVLIIRRPFASN